MNYINQLVLIDMVKIVGILLTLGVMLSPWLMLLCHWLIPSYDYIWIGLIESITGWEQ